MRVSDSQRLLFVHIPKTGGATIERVLDKNVPDVRFEGPRRHDTLSEILEREPELSAYWIFGFVRNPWARMVSWWSMIAQAKAAAEAGDEANTRKFQTFAVWKAVRDYPDFETFVLRGPEEVDRLRVSQIAFLSTATRSPDFIGRTENLVEDVNVIRQRLGLRPKHTLPHRHRGTHGPYRDYYTPKTRDRIASLFKEDIDTFGYEF
jgi:hypothetical protein